MNPLPPTPTDRAPDAPTGIASDPTANPTGKPTDLTGNSLLHSAVWSAFPAALALLVALACASALTLATGEAPLHVYRLLFEGTWGNAYGIGQVLFKATPLILTGLGVAVPYRAGLFNVGAEGQAVAGAFACGLAGAALPSSTPAVLAIPICLLAAFAGGAATGAIPGVLKATRGAHEVIVTIMLNFVVLAVLSDLGKRFYLRETVHTAWVPSAAALPHASALFPSLSGSALNAALLLALACAGAVWWLMAFTTFGFRMRAVGQNAEAASASGISVGAQTVWALASNTLCPYGASDWG